MPKQKIIDVYVLIRNFKRGLYRFKIPLPKKEEKEVENAQ